MKQLPDSPALRFGISGRSTYSNASRCLLAMLASVGLSQTQCFADALGDAVDAPALTFTTGGSANWGAQTSTTHDGVDAAANGYIGNSQESWLQTTVTGPGTLTWWWKVSSEGGWDWLEFYLDGVLQSGRISGEVDWEQQTQVIPAGTHTVKWRYQKDSGYASGADSGYLDEVVFALDGPVNTGSASNITETGATLNGAVNPTGLVTSALFEYGTTTAYGSTVNVTLSPNNGNSHQQVSAVLTGLQPSTSYHYRLVASNSSNPAPGVDRTFSTVTPYSYDTNNGEVTITGYTGTDTQLVIPSTINGLPVKAIGDYAFNYDNKITSVVIPSGVTSIGDEAFYNCNALTSVVIPSGVTSIGYGAFYNCDALTSVSIPGSVASFGSSIFSECDVLTNVTLGSGLSTIGSSMFSYCYSLVNVVIPSGVTSIGSSAFYECSGMTNATIPGTVASIGASAFSGCEKLTGVSLPAGLITLGSSAFFNCDGLTSITIPSGLTALPDGVFSSCSGLTSVTLSGAVTSIGSSAFSGCGSLAGFTLPASITYLGAEAFQGCSSLTGITIPSGVTSLPYGVFAYCSALTSVTIPSSVTTIEDEAFSGCESLASITLPSGVTSLSYRVFSGCSSLVTVTLSGPVTSIGSNAFSGCSKLSALAIPATVTSIGYGAFADCDALTSLVLPAGLTSLGSSAFSDCDKLTSMIIPTFVTSLGYSTFSDCDKLTSLVLPSGMTSIDEYAFSRCSSLASITLPAGLTTLGEGAFYECRALTSIVIPSGVSSISDNAFSGCSSLVSVTLPVGLTSISEEAFEGCMNLNSLALPASVTSIGDRAFADCASLTSLALPASLTSIGDGAFYGCWSLTSVSLPDATTSLGSSVFGDCASLQAITVGASNPNYSGQSGILYNKTMTSLIQCPAAKTGSVNVPTGVTEIESAAFYGCSKLTAITLPTSVGSIGFQAFADCSGIASLVIPNGISEISYETFRGCSGLVSVTIPSGVTAIYDGAFYYCESLTSVTLPATLTYIGYEAFRNCLSLTNIHIPAAVSQIESTAFTRCRSLTAITVDPLNEDYASSSGMLLSKDLDNLIKCPEGKSGNVSLPGTVTNIENSAFRYCSGITGVSIPNGVTVIEDSAFRYCSGLTSIILPDSLTRIGDFAFSGCASLFSIHIPASVTEINSCAFSGATLLKKAVFLGNAPVMGQDVFYPVASGFTVCYQTGKQGFSNPTWDEGYPSRGFASLTVPEIAVEKPGAVNLIDGGSSVSFGSVPVGSSTTMTFTVKNLGVADLTGFAITKDGANAPEFTVTANPAASVEGPSGSTTFTVKFAPAAAGTRSAALHIASNDPDESPFDIPLTGNATSPEISVTMGGELADAKSTVNFGSAKIKATSVKTFTVKNLGTAPLTGLAITKDGSHASNYTIGALGLTSLAPGASTTFKVTFKPTATGVRTAAIHIASNDTDEAKFDIKLTGTGTAATSSPKSAALAGVMTGGAESLNVSIDSETGLRIIKGVEIVQGRKYRALTVIDPSDRPYSPARVEVSSNLVDWARGRDHTTVLVNVPGLLKVRDNTPITPGTKRHIRWLSNKR